MEKVAFFEQTGAMNLQFRILTLEDLPRILDIERMSFPDPWRKNMFISEIESKGVCHNRGMVDLDSGRLAGYCFFWVIPEDEVYINNIAVHPLYRRLGIAKRLIQEAIDLGRPAGVIGVTLEVRESNIGARKFYEHLGFQEEGRRIHYYVNPKEDALILRLYLADRASKSKRNV